MDAAALDAAVATAVGGSISSIGEPTRTELDYDAFLAHRSVARVSGEAVVGQNRVPWSMIEKRTEGPGLASPYLRANGMRELHAYRSGLLEDIAEGVRAPRLHGSDLDADGGVTLWIEEVRHEGSRPMAAGAIVTAARDLGRMGGRWIGRVPDHPWLFRGWIDRHSQPEARVRGTETLRGARVGTAGLGDRPARGIRLIEGQDRVRRVLESLPQTLCHHDAVGANVFQHAGQTVLIDWESVGPGPVGADLASLLFSSVRRGDAAADTVAEVLEDALEAYGEGIREESPGIGAADIRRGMDASIALRWKLAADVVEGVQTGAPPRRGSLPGEDPSVAQADLLALLDLLLSAGERTLDP